ncbi:MAG: SDR family oxidoreductase [Planctomycetota bacterium]
MPDSNPEDRQKVALVTGGDQGIGRGVAEALAEDGWRVHVTYRTPEKGRRAVERLGEERVHEADLVDGAAAARAVEAVIEREGRLDAVVHAVGPYATGPLSETGPETFDAMLRGNLFTAIHVVTAARAHLRAASGAYLFFGCAGLERWRAREVTTAYIAAKAALLVTVRGLALEEAPHGVRANMISPGFVPHEGAAPDTVSTELHERIPIGRAAEMREVTSAARWLLSDDASHVVGQNVEVAGGWML